MILVTAQFVLSNFGDQIPEDDIGVLGTTGKPHARLVKDEFCDGRLVAVEADDNSGNLAIPQANAAIVVSNGEDVGVGVAAGNASDWSGASFVFPATEELAFLYIPAKNFFVGGDNGLACTGGIATL